MTKWGDRPHWEFDATHLGSDHHGDWLGIRVDTPISRPGVDLVASAPQALLSPNAGSPGGAWWMATFHDVGGPAWGMAGQPVAVYVDMTTPPAWDSTTLRAVDLDLDVVRGESGRVWVDDEDEFAEHRVAFSYPEDVVREALASCEAVAAAMRADRAPYDGKAHLPWLALAREL